MTVGGPMHSVEEVELGGGSCCGSYPQWRKGRQHQNASDRYAAPKYDWRVMQRFGIRREQSSGREHDPLKPPTLWELYRWQIVAIAAVILLQAALILGLLWEHRRRRRLEVEGRQRMAELAHMNRRATAGHLSASIAHELNQPLGAILNNAEAAALMIKSPSPSLEELETIVDDIKRDDQRASEVIKRLRRLLTRGAFDPQEVDLNESAPRSVANCVCAGGRSERDTRRKSRPTADCE